MLSVRAQSYSQRAQDLRRFDLVFQQRMHTDQRLLGLHELLGKGERLFCDWRCARPVPREPAQPSQRDNRQQPGWSLEVLAGQAI